MNKTNNQKAKKKTNKQINEQNKKSWGKKEDK